MLPLLSLLAVLTIAEHKSLGREEARALCFPRSGLLAVVKSGAIELTDLGLGSTQALSGAGAGAPAVVACSRDGSLLATGHHTGALLLWDADSGILLRTLAGHAKGILSVDFSPDGKRLASSSFDGTVRLWDVETGAPGLVLTPLKADLGITRAVFSPDGTQLATAGGDKLGRILVFDAATGAAVAKLSGHTRATWNLAWLPGGKQLVSVSGDGTVKVWDAKSGEVVRTLTGHGSGLHALAISPDGTLAASAGGPFEAAGADDDFSIRLWRLSTGEQLATFSGNASQVSSLAFSPDGATLASSALLDGVELRDLSQFLPAAEASGAKAARAPVELVVQAGHSDAIRVLAFSRDGRRLASGGDDRTVKLWDLRTGKELRTFAGFPSPIFGVGFSGDPDELLGATYDDVIHVWDVRTGREKRTLAGDPPFVVSPDGQTLLSAVPLHPGKFPRVMAARLQRMSDGAELHSFLEPGAPAAGATEPNNDVQALAFNGDGTKAAICAGASTRIVEVASGKLLRTLRQEQIVTAVAFQPGGEGVATVSGDSSGDGTVRLWSAAGEELHRIAVVPAGEYLYQLSFAPDGKTFVVGASAKRVSELRFYDVATGKLLRATRGSDLPHAAVYSPDGRVVASTGSDLSVQLWDAATAKPIRPIGRSAAPVLAAAFSRDAPLLASVSGDNFLRLWDLRTGRTSRGVAIAPGAQAIAFDAAGGVYITHAGPDLESPSTVHLDARSGERIGAPLPGDLFALSADGALIAYADSRQPTVVVQEAKSGKVLSRLDTKDRPLGLAFQADGGMLAVSSQRMRALYPGKPPTADGAPRVRVFLSATGTQLLELGEGGGKLAWSSAGLLARGSSAVELFDLPSPEPVGVLERGQDQSADVLAFSPDGALLAVAGMEGVSPGLRLYDVAKRREVARLTGHSDFVVALAFTSDGKTLASASRDSTIKLWDVASHAERATLVSMGPADQIIATPEGYYSATKGALLGVGFRTGQRSFPAEQYDLKLNRPDLVLDRIGYGDKPVIDSYRRAYDKRLAQLGLTEALLDTGVELPKLVLTTAGIPLSTRAAVLTLALEASDPGPGLDRLEVSVNEVPLFGTKGLPLEGRPRKVERTVAVTLARGRNKIQLSALSASGAESVSETIEVFREAEPRLPALYLLAIGVSQYADAQANLLYAAKDARDLAALFAGPQRRFSEVKVRQVLDGAATRDGVLAAKAFLSQAGVDDEVVVFFAGHGMLDSSLDYYFATTDMDFANPGAHGLSYANLESLLDGIPSRKKLLLIDSCNSGEVDKAGTALVAAGGAARARAVRGFKAVRKEGALGLSASFELQRELFADLRRGSGAVVISSASGVQYALESDRWKNGVFTYALIDGLRSGAADTDRSGNVTVSELRDYVIDKVQALTAGGQTPTSRRENLDFDFDIF